MATAIPHPRKLRPPAAPSRDQCDSVVAAGVDVNHAAMPRPPRGARSAMSLLQLLANTTIDWRLPNPAPLNDNSILVLLVLVVLLVVHPSTL